MLNKNNGFPIPIFSAMSNNGKGLTVSSRIQFVATSPRSEGFFPLDGENERQLEVEPGFAPDQGGC